MAALVIPFVVLIALVTLALIVVVGVVARRALLARQLGAFDCSLRAETMRERGRWRHGVARYGEECLDWFRVFGVRPRPAQSLSRRRLVILEHRAPAPEESYSVLPDWVVVRCGYGSVIIELAMSEGAYTGLAAWLESAPPGQQPLALG